MLSAVSVDLVGLVEIHFQSGADCSIGLGKITPNSCAIEGLLDLYACNGPFFDDIGVSDVVVAHFL